MIQRHSCECRCDFDGRKCNSRKKRNKYQCDCKKHIRHRTCKEDHVWNPRKCACECDKDCEIGEYLKDCECMKSLVDDAVVTCDEAKDIPRSVVILPSDGINY